MFYFLLIFRGTVHTRVSNMTNVRII